MPQIRRTRDPHAKSLGSLAKNYAGYWKIKHCQAFPSRVPLDVPPVVSITPVRGPSPSYIYNENHILQHIIAELADMIGSGRGNCLLHRMGRVFEFGNPGPAVPIALAFKPYDKNAHTI
jgi:hypothetical protein